MFRRRNLKALYIGHYNENSGWGRVTRDYILAMDSVGIDVVPRPIRLGQPISKLPEKITELEQKSGYDCDVCIQHVLPHYMKYDSRFTRNIGIYELETKSIAQTSWIAHLNLMDELWVPCTDMLMVEDVVVPTTLVPHAFDTSIYKKHYDKLNLPVQDAFSFYFIGEFSRRKHLSALVKAFHTEFTPEEPVELVIKVNKPGMGSDQLAQEMVQFCNKIKENLRLYPDQLRYKPEIIITIDISDEDILKLHNTCDCFVMPSYGEAWNIPSFEAMAMGNLVIASGTGGMKDYIDSERTGFLVNGNMEPIFGQMETLPEFGTARERWFEISVGSLAKTMRRVYNMDKTKQANIRNEAHMSVENYSYKTIGEKIKDLLNV